MPFLRRRRRRKQQDEVQPLKVNVSSTVRTWKNLRLRGGFFPQTPSTKEAISISPDRHHEHCPPAFVITRSFPSDNDKDETTSQLSELSVESLLEAWTVHDEVSFSDCHGIDRIRRRLEQRGQTFYRYTATTSKFYRDTILDRELQSRGRILQSHKPNDTILHEGLKSENTSSLVTRFSLLRRIQGILLLEGHSLEAAWIAIWYSMGHQSFYAVLDTVVKAVYLQSGISGNIFYLLLTFLGLMIMRLNGYLWFWLGQDSYRLVKFEIHNRLCLQYWDARILSWFRKSKWKPLTVYFSIVGYYLLYIGMVHFYYAIAWTQLEAWSWTAYTHLEATLARQLESSAVGADLCDEMLNTTSWYRHGTRFICHQWHSQDTPLLSIFCDGIVLIISSIAIGAVGGSIFEE